MVYWCIYASLSLNELKKNEESGKYLHYHVFLFGFVTFSLTCEIHKSYIIKTYQEKNTKETLTHRPLQKMAAKLQMITWSSISSLKLGFLQYFFSYKVCSLGCDW